MKTTAYNKIRYKHWRRLLLMVAMFIVQCSLFNVYAQIVIGGNVYGGGNAGDTGGRTKVFIREGDIRGNIFGGARQANVSGSAFVCIDGDSITGDITVNAVYGGNDIAGSIGSSTTKPDDRLDSEGHITNLSSYNAFILTRPERKITTTGTNPTTTQPGHIFIGKLYGGGNGNYDYQNNNGEHTILDRKTKEVLSTSNNDFILPELGSTYVDIHGGTFGYVFGGGDSATVTKAVNICINNSSDVTTEANGLKLTFAESGSNNGVTKLENLTTATLKENTHDQRLMAMGINLSTYQPGYNFLRVFGGNNKAPMQIRPTWHLHDGSIINLYSGGNEGMMTSPDGLLLEIDQGSNIEIENVFGGCRKADVMPLGEDGKLVTSVPKLEGYHFPQDFAARLLINGGTITNVYGGNDISGKVYFGNAIGLRTSISGSVYGGGNGAYAYTDKPSLKNDLIWGDYYYDPDELKQKEQLTNPTFDYTSDDLKSVEALNLTRPNAEQVSLRVAGNYTSDAQGNVTSITPTTIGGAIYVGGNCATLKPKTGATKSKAELKIGSYVIADKVFLGNNGEMMKDASPNGILAKYAGNVVNEKAEEVDFSTLTLTNATVFDNYMEGVAMSIMPSVVFDNIENGDPLTYKEYTTYFGSLYCGGNVGSMTVPGLTTIDFKHKIVVFDKVVGGCNEAYVTAVSGLNAEYIGGIIGSKAERTAGGFTTNGTPTGPIKDRLKLNFDGLKIQPKRWKRNDDPTPASYPTQLVWDTVNDDGPTPPVVDNSGFTEADLSRRFKDGNIYGGCYTSGVINGNVIINLDSTIVDREILFDEVAEDQLGEAILYGHDNYNITRRHTGVILGQQGMDVFGKALNVFGGGKGAATEIWGSTTINLNAGYTFQIYGGSEEGVIGRSSGTSSSPNGTYSNNTYTYEGKTYSYDPRYSCYVNMRGTKEGVSKSSDSSPEMAECEFIYGGGFEGPIAGNTVINLGKGRIFNSFAGSCNADILGHTETYIGRQVKADGSDDGEGFPWIRDIVYGGNDLGGTIHGEASFKHRVRPETLPMVHKYNANNTDGSDVLKANAYVEYLQGRADAIFGGCYGTYDYTEPRFATAIAKPGFKKPNMNNAFVNFRPTNIVNDNDTVKIVYGAGQGNSGDPARDSLQNRSYVLIDVPDDMKHYYENMEVFGAGAWGGVGMGITDETYTADKDKATAIIDLIHGQIGAAYAASYKEGVTRRTLLNVPNGSTINIGSIFGGGYGTETLLPCDVYEANVEYHSANAALICNPLREEEVTTNGVTKKVKRGNKLQTGAIYGGNNSERRTIFGKINIDVPVVQKHYQYGNTYATIYGAGYGEKTWSEYTEVNLLDGAKVYEVYGGGEAGRVLNAESVQKYINDYRSAQNATEDQWTAAWKLGGSLDPTSLSSYVSNTKTNLSNPLARTAEMDDRATKSYKYNTNVIINRGATVVNYAYGGGLGKAGIEGSGDVYGTTYIALLGGTVKKDVYAAGTRGGVYDAFSSKAFTASANAYIMGGTLRNVYGGGYMGSVGYHYGEIQDIPTPAHPDIDGETHVVIGIRPDQTETNLVNELKKVIGESATKNDYGYYYGVPAIQRNAYGGGEGETQKGGRGGAVYGTANITLNNGYIGYVYMTPNETFDSQGNIISTTETITRPSPYVEKIDDETYFENKEWKGTNRLKDCGNMFGGGYSDKSNVDFTNVIVWNGTIRNSLHGGAEIAAIGRGATEEGGTANASRVFKDIYKAGGTKVTMYNGHVKRNVFGGGKGYNILGYGGANELYTDGYIFGSTEVYIRGGEVGTDDGLALGYGNVFGGGDIGYVYSPGIKTPKTLQNQNITTGSPGHHYYYKEDGSLSEDCKVVVEPWLQIESGSVSYDGKTYNLYDYVPTDYLNTLPKKNNSGNFTGDWLKLDTGDDRGILIHNAVFAGGNVASNSDTQYANATTVYGNTTATLNDVFHRDFITVGTEHTGGLYGGGNLSVVDGYRELNITNYGTDYYGLKQTITIDEYRGLSNRERAYFQLEYECISEAETVNGEKGITINDVFYKKGSRLKEEEYLKLVNANPDGTPDTTIAKYWNPYGFCSIYAGRLLNSIQRADLCGVFGSRMVLQGAKDRVADVGEDIDYTINRIGELSLNQQRSVRTAANGYSTDLDTGNDYVHGNYFGIYSVVNYLGNLTSDVHFSDYYREPVDGTEDKTQSYYSYKASNHTSSNRNKGQSYNEVALASGVFLELTTENSTAEHKDYGYITGVIELDLINVKKDLVGGGFVYAKNEHRVARYYPSKPNVILSEYNKKSGDEAVTYKRYRYDKNTGTAEEWPETGDNGNAITLGHHDEDNDFGMYDFGETREWQTSGNFIHHEKRIVDDCYPINNAYVLGSTPYSEAHYWYVKGEVYIYEQKVSAYTGSANAYSKEVHLPLTITAASQGRLQLLNVKPNLYAYYTDNNGTRVKLGTIGDDGKPIDKITVNGESDTYKLNDVVTWWDWHQMSAHDRQYFVTETYVNCVDVNIDGEPYEAGAYVMDRTDYDKFLRDRHTVLNSKGETFDDDFTVFRSSNNIGHDTGYVLTFDMDSPAVWDDYYTAVNGTQKITKAEYQSLYDAATTDAERDAVVAAWREGPTFRPVNAGVYGKREYHEGDIVTEATWHNAGTGQENMERAWVATQSVSYDYTYTDQGETKTIHKTVNAGTAIPTTEYNAIGATAQAAFGEAFFCTSTVKLARETYLLYGELKTADEITQIKGMEGLLANPADIDAAMTPAYICTTTGEYGGQQFNTNTNYSAIEAWSSLSETDRQNFTYNYDALDLLTSPSYLVVDPTITTSPEHSETVSAFHTPYTDQVKVEYQAVFKKKGVDVSFNGSNLVDGAILTSEQFESLRNDKCHYTRVEPKNVGDYAYIANKNFIYLGTPYGKGQIVDKETYEANTSDVDAVRMTTAGKQYYCFEDYKKQDGTTVSEGTLISESDYKDEAKTPNYQQYFVIQGKEPTERTTLYVSRESDIYDVMKEKIISVVYQYTYYEDEDDGSVKTTNELHVINVHLQLESGVPTIGPLSAPATVLPGDAVGLKAPDVNPGLYEVLTNGWELFSTLDDAVNHRNGVPFVNNGTHVYWYQNQKNWVAFYSKTYLGKTYSNPVPLSVANYHDLGSVMADKTHHLYIDKDNVDRDCKIYINDYSGLPADEPRHGMNGLDQLKRLFDLSQLTTAPATGSDLEGHSLLGTHVKGADNLEFFLRTDLNHSDSEWTPIGNDGGCFEGTLHGDGHTISGLSNSLFKSLCGNVYNLGVTGSFTTAGIADTGSGYVENCWVKTSATDGFLTDTYPIIGNPTRTGTTGLVQMVNCYYPKSNAYKLPTGDSHPHGLPVQMADEAFYNGTVAYNLNGFYLNKRYYDHSTISNKNAYNYLTAAADGTLSDNMQTGYYPADKPGYVPEGTAETPLLGYVEHRFYDGDYRFASGSAESSDSRMRTVTVGEGNEAVTKVYYLPIWPDDYLFFGQTLSYEYVNGRTHQEHPSTISKSGNRLPTDNTGNRVYRAPAYFRNSKMGVTHFNPYAVFAQTKKDDTSTIAYKGLTAIDFTGNNDASYQQGSVSAAPYNHMEGGAFYPPLLDDGGLTDLFFANDLTRNILVYTKYDAVESSAARKTDDVVSSYLPDEKYIETNDTYRTVDAWDSHSDKVKGHRIQYINEQYVAQDDHMLVDRQDFNCPIPYTFADGKRMWYQRMPDRWVDRTTGWEAVSLPFTADVVTTDEKGELTHFFSGSTIGHEYWLREFKGEVTLKAGETDIYTAKFLYPAATTSDESKAVANTFLWDYYYESAYDRKDQNSDIYQEYYSDTRTYNLYPRLTKGKPYLIGFPGKTYYEFDLSGKWTPSNTALPEPNKLKAQTITFASKTGAAIGISDTETSPVTASGYTFKPTYLNEEITAGFVMNNNNGGSFDKVTTSTQANAFRPYFMQANSARQTTRSIIFVFGNDEDDDPNMHHAAEPGTLTVHAKKHKIVVESALKYVTDVRIVNTAGQTMNTFSIEPGETVETRIQNAGVYIVQTADGRYNKKLAVK